MTFGKIFNFDGGFVHSFACYPLSVIGYYSYRIHNLLIRYRLVSITQNTFFISSSVCSLKSLFNWLWTEATVLGFIRRRITPFANRFSKKTKDPKSLSRVTSNLSVSFAVFKRSRSDDLCIPNCFAVITHAPVQSMLSL